MRPTFLAMPVVLSVAAVAALAGRSAETAEATRTLRAELKAAPGQAFVVENLAGAMRVVAGSGETVGRSRPSMPRARPWRAPCVSSR